MKEVGTVIRSGSSDFVTVRIGRNSACGSCGKCGMSENQKHVDFHVRNTASAKVGDKVVLDIKDANTLRLSAVAYLIPLVFAVLAFVLALYVFKWPDWAALVSLAVGCAIAYLIVALIDKKMRHKWIEAPEMVEILKEETVENGGKENG